ncbi:MAG: phosphatidylglycerophosphatase A [Methanospirillum sp.]|nr:phosphatidylglycerophosphatase A [Methanospirillum sp.]
MFEIEERLAARGITREALVEAGMALYVPHGLEAGAARARLDALIARHLRDPNVAALLVGALLLEEELVERRRASELGSDPVFLVADEILGMAVAEVIAGTYARFEFSRYDRAKPGILGTLGPFLDDAAAGLVAGCTSRLYSEQVEG